MQGDLNPSMDFRSIYSTILDKWLHVNPAPIVNGTNVPFKGTLLASIAKVQFFGGISNGGTQELFVQCASGPGGTGNTQNDMKIYITYSADGTSYTTSTSS